MSLSTDKKLFSLGSYIYIYIYIDDNEFDLSTFSGRFKYFFETTNPMYI